MRSILFVMRYFINDKKDNLSFKFRNQIQAAKNVGLDVWYFTLENNSINLLHNDEKFTIFSYKECPGYSLLNSIHLYTLLYKAIPEAFRIKNDFDLVYLRSMTATPSMLKSLRSIKKAGAKVVVEIPTYPSSGEYKSEKRITRKVLMKFGEIMDGFRNKYIDLYTLIGDQAENYMGKLAININNGICLDLIPERKPDNKDDEIHCLALASMSRWQGYDRFIKGIFDYKKNGGKQKIVLHLAGSEGDGSLQQWKELSNFYHLENEVIFEGSVYGANLDSLVNLCDLGIGTLGGYRKNMGNSSTLKIREYTARGLPFIYSVKDKALTEQLTFALRVPDDDSPINMHTVIEFVNKTRNDKNMVKTMRNYAQENMSWERQFSKIIDKVTELNNTNNIII